MIEKVLENPITENPDIVPVQKRRDDNRVFSKRTGRYEYVDYRAKWRSYGFMRHTYHEGKATCPSCGSRQVSQVVYHHIYLPHKCVTSFCWDCANTGRLEYVLLEKNEQENQNAS